MINKMNDPMNNKTIQKLIGMPKENVDEDELKKIKKFINSENIDDIENYLNRKRTKDNFDNKINNSNYKSGMNNTNYDFSLMESESEMINLRNQNKINEFKNLFNNLPKPKNNYEIDIKNKK
jgi:hypothetical protein